MASGIVSHSDYLRTCIPTWWNYDDDDEEDDDDEYNDEDDDVTSAVGLSWLHGMVFLAYVDVSGSYTMAVVECYYKIQHDITAELEIQWENWSHQHTLL